ncbi:hypothetical protein BH24ACT26_BH24ACT26_08070 [soil metagenome]
MTERQSEVMSRISEVAKSRGEDINSLMSGPFGTFWHQKFYSAAPDAIEVEPVRKEAPIPETGAFVLHERALRNCCAKTRA